MISFGRRCGTLLIGLAGSGLLLLGAPPADPTAPGTVAVPTVSADIVPVSRATPSTAEQRSAVLAATNAERRKAGCAALTTTSKLTGVAQAHATDMAVQNYFSHTSQDGRSFGTRIRSTGLSFRTAGENIARGQRTPAEVVRAWMNSAGHRRNLLNCAFTRIGVGWDSRGNYWVQDFIG